MKKNLITFFSSKTLGLIQDKLVQKTHFQKLGLRQAKFGEIEDVGQYQLPLLIKSRRQGYDGRGNHKITDPSQLTYSNAYYVEELVPFVAELAVMVVRSLDGQVVSYPVVETVQTDGICTKVIAPCQQNELVDQAKKLAVEAVSSLTGAGVFGVEMFVLDSQDLLLNEVAPRPHNSGHYTIEACYTSQFEQHLRAIIGLSLGECRLKVESAIMYNLIGVDLFHTLDQIASIPCLTLHWYGKTQVR